MTQSIIWLHDEALRVTHPVFSAAPLGTKAVFIWDDTYLKSTEYSLKRLLFIYETLCTLSIDIIHGDTLTTLKLLGAFSLYVPNSQNYFIQNIISELSAVMEVHTIQDEPFVSMSKIKNFTRFFQYWKHAEQTAFMVNGEDSA
jgi:hypothetical protein